MATKLVSTNCLAWDLGKGSWSAGAIDFFSKILKSWLQSSESIQTGMRTKFLIRFRSLAMIWITQCMTFILWRENKILTPPFCSLLLRRAEPPLPFARFGYFAFNFSSSCFSTCFLSWNHEWQKNCFRFPFSDVANAPFTSTKKVNH